jgi:hypothetical protein
MQGSVTLPSFTCVETTTSRVLEFCAPPLAVGVYVDVYSPSRPGRML